ncbi:MAG: heme-copper oxidase subunit III [Thermoleophilia bacterium]|nr:heme-copper oxidase subunit III [Thermoleophilia bacterium]
MSAATDHPAPQIQPYRTGLRPETLGLIIFLVSEVALFGAFFMYYANLRILNGIVWPGDFDIPADSTSINTLILVLSSFTCEFALLSLERRKNGAVFGWLFATFMLGAVFLGLQVHEYMIVGFTPQDESTGTIFFTLTGLHGTHVFIGLVLLLFGMIRALTGRWSPERHSGLLGISIYWHFVDIVWVVLFTVVYCLPSS